MSGYAQWNAFTTYVINDVVFWEGVIFVCIQAPNLNHEPNLSPSWWAGGSGGGVNTVVGSSGITTTGSTAVVVSANLGSGLGGINYTTGTGTQLLTNLPTVGTGGTYSWPSSITTDAYGRISLITGNYPEQGVFNLPQTLSLIAPLSMPNNNTSTVYPVSSLTSSQWPNANVFTLTIRYIDITGSTSGVADSLLRVYAALSPTQPWINAQDGGALYYHDFAIPVVSGTVGANALVWTFSTGSSQPTLYFNAQIISPTAPSGTTSITAFSMVLSTVAQKMSIN
jgi:hypothetical protein